MHVHKSTSPASATAAAVVLSNVDHKSTSAASAAAVDRFRAIKAAPPRVTVADATNACTSRWRAATQTAHRAGDIACAEAFVRLFLAELPHQAVSRTGASGRAKDPRYDRIVARRVFTQPALAWWDASGYVAWMCERRRWRSRAARCRHFVTQTWRVACHTRVHTSADEGDATDASGRRCVALCRARLVIACYSHDLPTRVRGLVS